MYFIYTSVLRSILWQCFRIGVGIFQCHECILCWYFVNQAAQFMNIARQHLMYSIVDSTTLWMIGRQACSFCHIYLTQVSILESSLPCHHIWATDIVKLVHYQDRALRLNLPPYTWWLQEKHGRWSCEMSDPICLRNTAKRAASNAKRNRRWWSIANPAVVVSTRFWFNSRDADWKCLCQHTYIMTPRSRIPQMTLRNAMIILFTKYIFVLPFL